MMRGVPGFAVLMLISSQSEAQETFTLGGSVLGAGLFLAACPSPNPNLTAPPFVDGCPLPAAPLNGLATLASPNFTGAVSLPTLSVNTPAGLSHPLVINENLSGTVNDYEGPPSFLFHVNGQYAGAYISAFNNNLAATGPNGFAQPFWVDYSVGGSGVIGNQNAAMFTMEVTAPTNSAARGTRYYSPIYMNAFMAANDGGTGTDLLSSQGNIQGGSATVSLLNGATNMRAIEGWEIDVGVNAGSSVWLKNGLAIAALPSDAVHGTHEAMIDLGGQTGNIGWNNAIALNDWHSAPPLSASGCVLCTDGASHTIGTGIDLSSYTISGNFLKSTNFAVDGSGGVRLTAQTAPGTPTSGQFVIYVDVADNKLKAKGPNGTVTTLANP